MSRVDDGRYLSEDLTWALRLVCLGNDEQTIVRTLSKRHAKHGYHSLQYERILVERGSQAAHHYAERTARKAAAIAKDEPRVWTPYEATERLAAIYAQVDREPWPLELASARRALEAAFSIAFERGRVANMKLDLRTHAMRAGHSLCAVRLSRIKLDELGWLKRNPHDKGTSNIAVFVPPPQANIEETFLRASYVQERVLLAHDAFRCAALGDRGWHRFSYFARQPEIADEVLEYLDLIALRHGTHNAGHTEGMKFLEQRKRQTEFRDAIIPCSEASHAS